jgi:hypothetical protein
MGAIFTFERAVDSIRTYTNGLAVINELAPENNEYLQQFARAKGIITYMPIITDNGTVETLSKKSVPHNIAILITPRLANEIYFYISRRLIGKDIYTTILSERLHVQAPLDGGDSHEYRRLLSDMIPLRVLCFSLLAGHSHRFLHQKRLVIPLITILTQTVTYWFQPEVPIDIPAYHTFNLAESPFGKSRSWMVSRTKISLICKVFCLHSPLTQTMDIRSYIMALRVDDNIKKTLPDRKDEKGVYTSVS